MADSVRAAVLVAPGRYEVQEFPMPSLTEGALLMQVEMSGICGTDKHTFLGERQDQQCDRDSHHAVAESDQSINRHFSFWRHLLTRPFLPW